ncbi:hypothetical protein EXS74_03970 [Candidatus Woesearchaeota archaeon]|nr:hypothetical protein [Candidatus Woesearchaeota archaeon]
MANEDIPGLDMAEAIDWYESSGIEFREHKEGPVLPYPLEGRVHLELTEPDLYSLLELFPKAARQRSILQTIRGKPTTWFRRDSTAEEFQVTQDIEQSISPTALVPSFIDYGRWKNTGTPSADIWLYKLPQEISRMVRRIILAQGFVHEYGHSIIAPALYTENYKLLLPSGREVEGLEYILEFAKLAEEHAPISHYAATFRGEGNLFESANPTYNVKTAIAEEMTETIAAYLLGFSFCEEEKRRTTPFIDRPEIQKGIEEFLAAEHKL